MEALIAVFLTAVAVVSIMSMPPLAFRMTAASDLRGRAVGIMERELENSEYLIMRGGAIAATTTSTIAAGNYNYTVVTTAANNPAGSNRWLVHTVVTWPGNTTGIRSSMILTRQDGF